MKNIILLTCLILLSFSVFAQDLMNSDFALIDLSLNTNLRIDDKGRGGRVDYLTVDYRFFPKIDIGQDVRLLETEPLGQISLDSIRFHFESPDKRSIPLNVRSTVAVYSKNKVMSKISYPFQTTSLPDEIRRYTEPSPFIDSNNSRVIEIARSVKGSETDLFILVSKIASWTKATVEYDLSTLNLPVGHSASEVLLTKKGVCRELTTVFIALVRALGIPARFITGVSYARDSPVGDWAPHGWAEVYFPKYGWIPFDPTFGEYGWVDSGHVKFLESRGPSLPSINFEWRGPVSVTAEPTRVEGTVKEARPSSDLLMTVTVKSPQETVGFGSFAVVQAEVTNPTDHYFATELRLAKVNELEYVDSLEKPIILEPSETESVFWIVRVNSSLKESLLYTIPLFVSTIRNESGLSHLVSRLDAPVYSLSDVRRDLVLTKAEISQKYSKIVDFVCSPDKSEFFSDEVNQVNCEVLNRGKDVLDSSICFQKVCKRLSVYNTGNVSFPLVYTQKGKQEYVFTLEAQNVFRKDYVIVEMLDEPLVDLEDFKFPLAVSYGQKFNVSFILAKKSYSQPQSVKLILYFNGRQKEIPVGRLVQDQPMVFEFDGSEFYPDNSLQVSIAYLDKNGKEFTETKAISLPVEPIGFFKKFFVFVGKFLLSLKENIL